MSGQSKESCHGLPDIDIAKIESLTDGVKFDRLLGTVEKICFGHNPDYPELEHTYSVEPEVVSQIGVFGLRTALDHSNNVLWDYSDQDNQEFKSEYDRNILPDSMLRLPFEFHDSTDIDIVHRSEQFGRLLLEKSFASLGPDAPQKAREMNNATTEQEQMEIIMWLNTRLVHISYDRHGIDHDDEDFDSNDGLYHPARLSPLAIGKYPNINISPTCLGVSVLAASFFEKSGLNHMHAGVMEARLEGEDATISAILGDRLNGDYIPTHMQDYISKISDSVYKRSVQDFGFHAANVVQLTNGKWLQFDANFGSIDFLDKDMVDKNYHDLTSFKDIAPGLEVTFSSLRTVAGGIEKEIYDIKDIAYDYDQLCDALLSSDESIEESIRSVVMPPIQKELYKNDGDYEFLNESLEHAFHKCLQRLVLWDNPIDEVRKKALDDRHYLQRVIEDMQDMWKPTLLMMLVTMRDIQSDTLASLRHSQLELGMPAQRIGLAVLNDFDTYLDSGLSPGFWSNNWPSHIPRIEAISRHTNNVEDSEQIYQATRNNAAWFASSLLRYSKSDGIINSFLQEKGTNSAAGQSQEAR